MQQCTVTRDVTVTLSDCHIGSHADVRRAACDALFAVQPCLGLLQSAWQLWQPQQNQPQCTVPLQPSVPSPQPGQHVLPHNPSAVQSPDTQGNDKDTKLPPLPESKLSALRQQFRLASLHLAEEEVATFSGQEGDQARQDERSHEEEDEMPAGTVIHIPAELQVIANSPLDYLLYVCCLLCMSNGVILCRVLCCAVPCRAVLCCAVLCCAYALSAALTSRRV